MDLTFQKNTVAYLQKLVSQVNTREETAEITVPDQEPDIGRVVSTWAVPVVRNKEQQSGSMAVSGGISAWVLYVPADGGNPRTLSAYLPFSMKWELPVTELESSLRVSCRTQSVDARMVNARKVLVRVTVACLGEAFGHSEAEFYSLPDPPEDLEVLSQRLPVLLPTEMEEKSFQLDESLDMPTGAPEVRRIVAYQLQPVISDSKVMGEKAVFKGNCALHLIYMTPEDRLAVWDFDIPFSQYTELTRNYDQEEELHCIPLISGIDLEPEEDGQGLRLKCGLMVQCTVLSRHNMDLVTDLYSLRQQVTPQSTTIPIRTRLDHQTLRQMAEVSFPIHRSTMIDCTVLPGFSKVNHSGDTAMIETSVWSGVLYYDETGTLQGRQSRASSMRELNLAAGCPCQATSEVSGPVQWTVDGGGTTVRAPLELNVDSFSNQELTMLRGASLGEKTRLDPNRPSLIVRAIDDGESLWTLAKDNGSTVDAIRKANRLKPGAPESGRLLLIPVL